jgi:hypothetical protein
MMRLLLWLTRCWHAYQEAQGDRVSSLWLKQQGYRDGQAWQESVTWKWPLER